MEQTVGTITFTPYYVEGLQFKDALDAIKSLKLSEQAGWNAYAKAEEKLDRIKEYLCKDCLLKLEGFNGKKIHGQDKSRSGKTGRKVCGRKRGRSV